MGSFGVLEWAIILLIILLIFGVSRLTDIGKGLGGAIKEFKKALEEDESTSEEEEEKEQDI